MKTHGSIPSVRPARTRRTGVGRSDLERRLVAHYDDAREGLCARSGNEARDRAALASAMVAARRGIPDTCPARVPSFSRFVAAQARFIGPGTWLAHVALVLLAVALCIMAPNGEATSFAVAAVGAATMLVEVPPLLASKTYGVSELEYACVFDHRSALTARMVALGCSAALLVTALAGAMPALTGTTAVAVLVHVCPPYFLSCIGCLEIARRVSAANATSASAAWCFAVAGVTLALWLAAPQLYAATATGAWGLAGAAALIGVLHEARLLLRQAGQGLDAVTPRAATA